MIILFEFFYKLELNSTLKDIKDTRNLFTMPGKKLFLFLILIYWLNQVLSDSETQSEDALISGGILFNKLSSKTVTVNPSTVNFYRHLDTTSIVQAVHLGARYLKEYQVLCEMLNRRADTNNKNSPQSEFVVIGTYQFLEAEHHCANAGYRLPEIRSQAQKQNMLQLMSTQGIDYIRAGIVVDETKQFVFKSDKKAISSSEYLKLFNGVRSFEYGTTAKDFHNNWYTLDEAKRSIFVYEINKSNEGINVGFRDPEKVRGAKGLIVCQRSLANQPQTQIETSLLTKIAAHTCKRDMKSLVGQQREVTTEVRHFTTGSNLPEVKYTLGDLDKNNYLPTTRELSFDDVCRPFYKEECKITFMEFLHQLFMFSTELAESTKFDAHFIQLYTVYYLMTTNMPKHTVTLFIGCETESPALGVQESFNAYLENTFGILKAQCIENTSTQIIQKWRDVIKRDDIRKRFQNLDELFKIMWATAQSRAKTGRKVKRETESFDPFRVFLNMQSRLLANFVTFFWENELEHMSKIVYPENGVQVKDQNIIAPMVAKHFEMRRKVLFPIVTYQTEQQQTLLTTLVRIKQAYPHFNEEEALCLLVQVGRDFEKGKTNIIRMKRSILPFMGFPLAFFINLEFEMAKFLYTTVKSKTEKSFDTLFGQKDDEKQKKLGDAPLNWFGDILENLNLKNDSKVNETHSRTKRLAPLALIAPTIMAGNAVTSLVTGDAPLSWFGGVLGSTLGLVTKQDLKLPFEEIKKQAVALRNLTMNQLDLANAYNELAKDLERVGSAAHKVEVSTTTLISEMDNKMILRQLHTTIQITILKLSDALTNALNKNTSPYVLAQSELENLSAKYRAEEIQLSKDINEVKTTVIKNKEGEIIFLFEVPIYSTRSLFYIYSARALPLYDEGKNLIPIVDIKYFGLSVANSEYTILTSSEKEKCLSDQFCNVKDVLRNNGETHHCVIKSFNKNVLACPMEVNKDEQGFYELHGSKLVYSVPKQTEIKLICHNKTTNHHMHSSVSLHGVGLARIAPDCQIILPNDRRIFSNPEPIQEKLGIANFMSMLNFLPELDNYTIQIRDQEHFNFSSVRQLQLRAVDYEIRDLEHLYNETFNMKSFLSESIRVIIGILAILFLLFIPCMCSAKLRTWFKTWILWKNPKKWYTQFRRIDMNTWTRRGTKYRRSRQQMQENKRKYEECLHPDEREDYLKRQRIAQEALRARTSVGDLSMSDPLTAAIHEIDWPTNTRTLPSSYTNPIIRETFNRKSVTALQGPRIYPMITRQESLQKSDDVPPPTYPGFEPVNYPGFQPVIVDPDTRINTEQNSTLRRTRSFTRPRQLTSDSRRRSIASSGRLADTSSINSDDDSSKENRPRNFQHMAESNNNDVPMSSIVTQTSEPNTPVPRRPSTPRYDFPRVPTVRISEPTNYLTELARDSNISAIDLTNFENPRRS